MAEFEKAIGEAYRFEGDSIELGRGVHEGEVVEEAADRFPLATSNRHGLIAGATGTGKTRTLQLLAEQLSAAGVPVFAADVKGDVSGIAAPGEEDGPAEKRAAELGQEWSPTGFPTEYLSIGGIGPGVPVRATVSDFGPLLLAKVLEANETQEQSLSLVFRYADEKGPPDRRPRRPEGAAHVLRLRRGERRAESDRRRLVGDDRRPASFARAARGRRRHRILRRAAARDRRPAAGGS